MTRPSWRDEKRQDRLTEARIARERDSALAEAAVARQRADAEIRREDRRSRLAQRAGARKARAGWWAERLEWVSEHRTGLLFVPVIAVPGALAWSAMAAYGSQVFGPVGLALPAFSEGTMWVFEVAATWTMNRHPGRPTWHLRLGSWVFAAVGAALNFLHGLTAVPGHPHGVVVGVVMAIVSAAGLVAHQLVNMGPRRARAERHRARLERATARRELAVQRAALRRARADVGADGRARLVVTAGRFTPARRRGRVHLDAAPQPAPVVWLPWPMVLPGERPAAVTARPDDADIQTALAAYLDRHAPDMAASDVADDDRPDMAAFDRAPDTHLAVTGGAPEPGAAIAPASPEPVTERPDMAAMHSAERGEVASPPESPASSEDAAMEPPAEPVTDAPPSAPGSQHDRPSARPETARRRRPENGQRRGQSRPSDGPKQAAMKALRDQPDMDTDALAAAIGRSPRTARRIRSELAMANGHGQEGG